MPPAQKAGAVQLPHRHIGGSILPSSTPHILAPIATRFGVLQVRALPDLDTHALFLSHARGVSMLVTHSNGYSCHHVARHMADGAASEVRKQVDYIVACGGLAAGIDGILAWMSTDDRADR